MKTLLAVLVIGTALASAPAQAADAADIAKWAALIEQPKAPDNANQADWIQARLNAQRELANAGRPAVQPLIDIINRSKDNQVRIVALIVLTSMKDAAVLKPVDDGNVLPGLLKDTNPGVRYMAIKLAGKMQHTASAPQVEKLVADPEQSVSLMSIDALGQIGALRSAPILIDLINSPDKTVELHVVQSLGTLGAALTSKDNNRIDIVAMLTTKLPDMAEAAEAINKITGYDLTADLRWTKKLDRPLVVQDFQKWWTTAIPNPPPFPIPGNAELELRVNLGMDRNQPVPIRLRAIEMMARIGDKAAVDYLIMIMTDTNEQIRKAAAAAATQLTGIAFPYDPSKVGEWMDRVPEFRRKWEEAKSGG